MSRYTTAYRSKRQQENAIKKFKEITGQSDNVAKRILEKYNWDKEAAADHYFENSHLYPRPPSKMPKIDEKKLNTLFNKYTNGKEDTEMSEDGQDKFFEDISLDVESIAVFALAFKLDCKEFGVITRKEFCRGFQKMGCDSNSKIKQKLAAYLKKLNKEQREYRSFYRWIFLYVRDDESQRKTIDLDDAVGYWELVLPNWFGLLDDWIEFVSVEKQKEDEQNKIKHISKDVWEMVFDFAREVNNDLSNYSEDDGCWPVVIDEFCAYVQKKKGGGSDEKKNDY